MAVAAFVVARHGGAWRLERALARMEERGEPRSLAEFDWPIVEKDAMPWLVEVEEAIHAMYYANSGAEEASAETPLEPGEGVSAEFDLDYVAIALGEDAIKARNLNDRQCAWLRASTEKRGDVLTLLGRVDEFIAVDGKKQYESLPENKFFREVRVCGALIANEMRVLALDAAINGDGDALLVWLMRQLRLATIWSSHSAASWSRWGIMMQDAALDTLLELLPLAESSIHWDALDLQVEALDPLADSLRWMCPYRASCLDEYEFIRSSYGFDSEGWTGMRPYTRRALSAMDQALLLEFIEEWTLLVQTPPWARDYRTSIILVESAGRDPGWEGTWDSAFMLMIDRAPVDLSLVDQTEAKRRLSIAAIAACRFDAATGAQRASDMRDHYKDQALSSSIDDESNLTLWSVGLDGVTGTDDDIIWRQCDL